MPAAVKVIDPRLIDGDNADALRAPPGKEKRFPKFEVGIVYIPPGTMRRFHFHSGEEVVLRLQGSATWKNGAGARHTFSKEAPLLWHRSEFPHKVENSGPEAAFFLVAWWSRFGVSVLAEPTPDTFEVRSQNWEEKGGHAATAALGCRIRAVRKWGRTKLELEELAQAAKLPTSTLAEIESGRNLGLSEEDILHLGTSVAQALGIAPRELLHPLMMPTWWARPLPRDPFAPERKLSDTEMTVRDYRALGVHYHQEAYEAGQIAAGPRLDTWVEDAPFNLIPTLVNLGPCPPQEVFLSRHEGMEMFIGLEGKVELSFACLPYEQRPVIRADEIDIHLGSSTGAWSAHQVLHPATRSRKYPSFVAFDSRLYHGFRGMRDKRTSLALHLRCPSPGYALR